MVVSGGDVVDVCGVAVAPGGVPPPGGGGRTPRYLGGAAHWVGEAGTLVVVVSQDLLSKFAPVVWQSLSACAGGPCHVPILGGVVGVGGGGVVPVWVGGVWVAGF